MKLELGKIQIGDIQFADRTYIENHVLYVNKEEVEKMVLEDDKLLECHLDIARPGDATRITPVKDVIEPRVKVSGGGEIFPGVIGKVSPTVGEGRTHALEGCCVVTVGRIVGFQEGVIDMSGPAADYCPFSKTVNMCMRERDVWQGLRLQLIWARQERMWSRILWTYLRRSRYSSRQQNIRTFRR